MTANTMFINLTYNEKMSTKINSCEINFRSFLVNKGEFDRLL